MAAGDSPPPQQGTHPSRCVRHRDGVDAERRLLPSPGIAAAKTGSSVVLAYFLASVLAVPALLSKAELATAMPRAGGVYYFLDRSLGPMVGHRRRPRHVAGPRPEERVRPDRHGRVRGAGPGLPRPHGGRGPDRPLRGPQRARGEGVQRRCSRVLVVLRAGVPGPAAPAGRRGPGGGPGEAGPARQSGAVLHARWRGPGVHDRPRVHSRSPARSRWSASRRKFRTRTATCPLGMFLALLTASAVYVVGVWLMVEVIPPGGPSSRTTRRWPRPGERLFGWLPGPLATGLVLVPAIAGLAAAGNAGILAASTVSARHGTRSLDSRGVWPAEPIGIAHARTPRHGRPHGRRDPHPGRGGGRQAGEHIPAPDLRAWSTWR